MAARRSLILIDFIDSNCLFTETQKKRIDSDILKVKKIIVVRGAACIILTKDTASPLSHQMMAS